MKAYLLSLLFVLGMSFTLAQSPIGKWKTIDDETKKAKSIVEIYKGKDGKLYGKILKLLIKPENSKCVKCSGKLKNKPLVGLVFLTGLEKDGDEYGDGNIVDPKTGKDYSCYIKLINANKLKVRGYMGFSVLGRTQYWQRVK